MLNSAVEWRLLAINPCSSVKPPKVGKTPKKLPSESDLAKLIDKLNSAPLKNRLWCMLAFALGMRREEIFGLKWQDIDFTNNTITIDRAAVAIPGKGIEIKDCKTDNSHRKLSAAPDI